MQYQYLSSGTTCSGGTATWQGSGWGTFGARVGRGIHNKSDWPGFNFGNQICDSAAGDPKVVEDEVTNSNYPCGVFYYAQMCTSSLSPAAPLIGGNGLVMAASTDRGNTLGAIDVCEICGPTGRACNAAGSGAPQSVDAPDLYFAPDAYVNNVQTPALFAAWQGGTSQNTYFSVNVVGSSSPFDCTKWSNPVPATQTSGLPQNYPSIAIWTVTGNNTRYTYLLIAYSNPNPSGGFDINVAFSNSDDLVNWQPWQAVNVATGVVEEGMVDGAKVTQMQETSTGSYKGPRPKLIRAGTTPLVGDEVFIITYPALVNGVNTIVTQYSTFPTFQWQPVTGLAPSNFDRFFPTLANRYNTNEVLLAWYEQYDGIGDLIVNSSELSSTSNTWGPVATVSLSGGNVQPFQPCTLNFGSAPPSATAFYGDYIGMAGGLSSPSAPSVYYPAWADSRNATPGNPATEGFIAPITP